MQQKANDAYENVNNGVKAPPEHTVCFQAVSRSLQL